MISLLSSRYIYYIVLSFIGLYVSYLIMGDALWHPNDYIFMNGGDGYIIYFNSFFHTAYGDGVSLTSMNYMDPECILMTDAQAIISLITNSLASIFPEIAYWIPSIFHLLIVIGIVVQFYLLFHVLIFCKIEGWWAVLGAALIGSLSPQLIRPMYGHFGLAYPFMVPLAMIWLTTSWKRTNYIRDTFLTGILFLFFGCNNPYLIFIVGLLIFTFGTLQSLFFSEDRKEGFIKICFSIVLLSIVYFIVTSLDPFDDRIQQQWGHFYHASKLSGLLAGLYSLQYDLLFEWFKDWEFRVETQAGVSMSALIGGMAYAIFKIINKTLFDAFDNYKKYLLLLSSSSLLIFLYSSSFFADKHWQMFASQIDALTMIKASGRLSWVPYYVISLVGFIGLHRLRRNRHLKIVIYLTLGLWLYEGHRYLSDHCKASLYPNTFQKESLDTFLASISWDNDADYQAILPIPSAQSWNDNILREGEWTSETQAIQLASATGIPLLNSRLSRAPVDRSLANVQMTSHPLIRKVLTDRLESSRPILLVKGFGYEEPTESELWIIERSETIYSSENVELFSIYPETFYDSSYVNQLRASCQKNVWYEREGFSTENGANGFVGSGFQIGEDWKTIATIEIPDSLPVISYELSIWSEVNKKAHGMPFYKLFITDHNENIINEITIDSRRGDDTQFGWLRSKVDIELMGGHTCTLSGYGRYPMSVDEVLLKPVDATVCYGERGTEMINNFILE